MTMLTRLLALLALTLFISPDPLRAAPATYIPLSPADQRVALHASHLAPGHPLAAVRWLLRSRWVLHADLGRDRLTVQIDFRDGSTVALLPSTTTRLSTTPNLALTAAMSPRAAGAGAVKAVVLEPFAGDLGLGDSAGQPEVDLLSKAGFSVDVYRNAQVTVPVMENLAQYGVVYMLTHSGVLDNGHAMILLGETNQHPYSALLNECSSEKPPLCSVMQAIGQGENKLSLAVTDYFIQKHMGAFPNSSLFFLNGCEILSAPPFVQALRDHNVTTLVGWDGKVESAITETSAQMFFTDLTAGWTVDATLKDLSARGYASSAWDNQTTYLKDSGFGDLTLSETLAGTAPPTATPTTTPTSSITPTPLPATSTPVPTPKPASQKCPKYSSKKHGKCVCKTGYKMKKGKCVRKK